ncbi:MAG: HRDC domain-containing protein, partial [Bacteroidia bacterium]|nr:HRDC domain-containing protein [Bacteroidia bacterium]MDW8134742.1 HRDC domain-containing protein [Bacteroidia bacterium]
FGSLKGYHIDDLRSYVTQLLVEGYLQRDPNDYSLVFLTEKGYAFLENPQPVLLYPPYDRSAPPSDEGIIEELILHDEILLEKLKELRKKIAQELRVPPYVIFQETTLIEMATQYPIRLEELERISGVGPVKAQKFGRPFVELIQEYVEENDIERPVELIVPTQQRRQADWAEIIQSIDQRIPLPTIARRLALSLEELLEKIEQIVFLAGVRLKLDYAVQSMIDADRVDEAFDYFYEAEDDDIEKAMRALRGEYTYEELRLLRLHFHLSVTS